MKKILMFALLLLGIQGTRAQENGGKSGMNLPITISLFTESIGLPNFRFAEGQTNLGIRIGTEFHYKDSGKSQLIQTVNLGYYVHKGFHNALFVNSEFGYRRYFDRAFLDGTIGVGYALPKSALPRYEGGQGSFEPKSQTFGRFFPTLGLGAGYRFNDFSVFSRYEMYGEMPFGFKGVPALPHSAFHLGTRMEF